MIVANAKNNGALIKTKIKNTYNASNNIIIFVEFVKVF